MGSVSLLPGDRPVIFAMHDGSILRKCTVLDDTNPEWFEIRRPIKDDDDKIYHALLRKEWVQAVMWREEDSPPS